MKYMNRSKISHYMIYIHTYKKGRKKSQPWPAGSPAMDHNGSVTSLPLYHQHLLNDVNDGTGGGAQTLRSPA